MAPHLSMRKGYPEAGQGGRGRKTPRLRELSREERARSAVKLSVSGAEHSAHDKILTWKSMR
ncbi:hypothetical protein CW704_01315 [Candidatus Bathyarchaeota archaeon]|nr:MAG: hypothetical protein CW704_01315 [Candidatus Bathyarchaeota archaeon]